MNTTIDTDFTAFAHAAANEVDTFRTNCHLSTSHAPTPDEINALANGLTISGVTADGASECYYCGQQAIPFTYTTTGARPFPHHTHSGDLCLYGTLVENTAITPDVLR